MKDTTVRAQAVCVRPISGPEDFWRVRELLVRLAPIAPPFHAWDVRWWDAEYFYNPSGRWENGWEAPLGLWETGAGRLVGCVNWEHPGDAWLQVDPAYRFLEGEMIEWAEARLAGPDKESGGRSLEFLVLEYDALRQRLLGERGYAKLGYGGMFRRMHLPAQALPAASLAEPYLLRQVNPDDDADCWRIADLLNAAFHRTFHNGPEFKTFAHNAPCYVNALDLAAVAPDGSFAAYVGMTYDDVNRCGIFEPVCTHPDHLRHGLASGLMHEALHRVQGMGAATATVGTGDMIPANALYDSLGFTEAYRAFTWRKVWTP